MKWKRWLWAGLGLVLLLPLLGRVHVRLGHGAPPQWDPKLAARIAKYLEDNRQGIELSDFRPTLLDTTGKRIILLGEEHGMATMDELDLAMLRYLHSAAGVRTYLAEIGYAYSCLVNQYVESGDEQVLNLVMHESAKSPAWTKERRAFYVGLRQWSQTLPASERVRIVGVDIEHQHRLAFRFLADLARQRSKAAPEIRDTVDKLSWIAGEPLGQTVGQYTQELQNSLATHRPAWAALVGDRLFEFDLVVENLARTIEYYKEHGSPRSMMIREHAIYETFHKLYGTVGSGRWYGRWGAFHVLQRGAEAVDPFATMLNGPESPVAGRILTIYPLYSHSEARNGYQTRQVDTDAARSRPFASAALAARMTLFRLDAEGSPFRQKVPGFLQGRGVPTDSAQYVVLIRNATASHPLEL